jgi:hypothetical protein
VGAAPYIFVTSDSTPLERNDVQTVHSQSEQREAHCKITENVVHPRQDCVGAGAPLPIEGRQHGLDMGSPIEVAKQDLAMRQRPGNSRHRPGHQIPTGAGKEFHMSKDDTKQAGIMFASGHFLMHRAHWREKKGPTKGILYVGSRMAKRLGDALPRHCGGDRHDRVRYWVQRNGSATIKFVFAKITCKGYESTRPHTAAEKAKLWLCM